MAVRSNIIGQELESVTELRRFSSVTLTCAAAGNYTAGDVMSNSATGDAGVALEVPVGGRGEIVTVKQIVAVCSEDSVLNRLRLHFYNYNPAAADVEMDDNAAGDFAKNSTGAAGYLGSIPLPAFRDGGTSMAVAEANLVDKLLACSTTLGSVYMVVETLDDETNETAGMTIRFDFYLS